MKSRLHKVLSALATPIALLVLVIVLGFSFLSIVLVPGLELASEVADSSTALKLLGEQQRHPTLIRASLESMRERLGDRGYIQESLDQLRTSSSRVRTRRCRRPMSSSSIASRPWLPHRVRASACIPQSNAAYSGRPIVSRGCPF